MALDMEVLGAPPEVIASQREQLLVQAQEPEFDVMTSNVPAVRLFLALQTQWRAVTWSTWSRAETVRTGLDYGAIEPTARMARIELGDGDFDRLRVMEVEALGAWNSERKRRK